MSSLIAPKLAKPFCKWNWLASNTPCLVFVVLGLTSVGNVGAVSPSVGREKLKSSWTNECCETR